MKQEQIKVIYTELEARAKVCGLPFREILRRAEFTSEQWYRWKRGDNNPFKNINKIIQAVEDAERAVTPQGEDSPLFSPTGRET